MKKSTIILVLALLAFLVSCSAKYITFQEDSFSAQYPEWGKISNNELVDVVNGQCEVKISIQDSKFDPSDLKVSVDVSIIPALKRSGLFIENYNLNGNEAILEMTANNAYGKQKYIACNNKLYKVSAGCNKKNNLIDVVINSASCSSDS